MLVDMLEGDYSKLTPKHLDEAADKGDEVAIEVWEEVGTTKAISASFRHGSRCTRKCPAQPASTTSSASTAPARHRLRNTRSMKQTMLRRPLRGYQPVSNGICYRYQIMTRNS